MTSATTVNQTSASTPAAKPKRRKSKLEVGTPIRVLESVVSPDFPDISFGGWTGKVVEVSGRKAPYKYFIEWDEDVAGRMPQSYIDRCEAQQIYYRWACLTDADFTQVD